MNKFVFPKNQIYHNMKFRFLLMALLAPLMLMASHDFNRFNHNEDPYLKVFVKDIKRVPDAKRQLQLSESQVWKQFSEQNGGWTAIFNEETGLPHNAYGKPVMMGLPLDPQSTAWAFISSKLAPFQLPLNELYFRNTAQNKKYYYVNYTQKYNNLEVLWSKVQIKITKDGRVNQFLCDAYKDIHVNINPTLSSQAAISSATNGLNLSINSTSANSDLKILPVPSTGKNIYHLVYEVTVKATDSEGFPREYYTLVDAHNGEVLYRHNNVSYFANTDINLTATVYPTNPYQPTAVKPLPNLYVTSSSVQFVTDANGYLGLANTSSTSANFKLEGTWAKIITGNNTPQFTATLNPGVNNITFSNANIRELSAYNFVNEIHDYYVMKAMGSGAEAIMDFQMQSHIDVAGTCNAYYDGDLNFYAAGGNCNATSTVNDVVYHEYGHGVNEYLYDYYGGFFNNGALHEGYADTWANGLTEDAVLGIGFFSNDPNGYVRRYDIDKKVYPQDIMGEPHADGEIIAGAWWDVALNFNSVQQRQDLFFETFAATIMYPDGQEGQLYTDILIEALTDDDNDGDLTNGTPNYCDITSAFAIHGIVMYGAGTLLTHTPLLSAAGQQQVTLNVTAPASFATATGSAVNGFYRLNGTGSWNNFTFTYNGTVFQGNIPAQPNGTIIEYYIDANDQCGTHFNVMPSLANASNPNIPYYTLVGYSLVHSDYFDTGNSQGWSTSLPGDNATTGMWEIASTVGSDLNQGFPPPNYVQLPVDHTPTNNNICAVTGNAGSNDPAGTNDVDDGKTSLVSPIFDLSGYSNPAISYWRMYSNDQGATPGTDFWQVYLSNDGGATYIPLENTDVSDHDWRRFAFRVADHLTPNANVRLKFVAEDANAGSLIEAMIDDIEIWSAEPTGLNQPSLQSWYAYPNPAKDYIRFGWKGNDQQVKVTLLNYAGQVVFQQTYNGQSVNETVSLRNIADGIYTLQLKGEKFVKSEKISVIR